MKKIRKTQEVYDACANYGIMSYMIDNYPIWSVKNLVKRFREENKA